MEHLYAEFTRERQFVHNVSESTLESYRWTWKAFEPVLTGRAAIAKAEVVDHIGVLRAKGSTPVTINTYLRRLNAFLRWLHAERHADTLLKFPQLKEQQKVMQTFSEQQVRRLIDVKGKTRFERQVQTIACLILDTGLRIDEALSLDRETDLDLENLLLTVRQGKGSKDRVVPFSPQMRKRLFRHLKTDKPAYGSLLFFAGGGDKIEQRNALRVFKRLCERCSVKGVRASFHTLRHTFATFYLRNGGDVFRLQRILGHSSLEMTRRYVQLQTDDLRRVHDRLSPLSL